MEDLKILVKEVLADGYIMNLGTTDQNGPWVAGVIYIADDDFNLYWISLPSARHSQAIAKNPLVACSIVAEQAPDKERALQIQGHASLLSESSLERELELRKKQGKALPTQEGEILKNGHKWFKLVPTKLELIHNKQFGWERKKVL